MRKKILAVMVVVMVVGMSFSLFASGLGSIGLVNFASMGDLEAGNEDAYVPGIRGELYLSDYLAFRWMPYCSNRGPVPMSTGCCTCSMRWPSCRSVCSNRTSPWDQPTSE